VRLSATGSVELLARHALGGGDVGADARREPAGLSRRPPSAAFARARPFFARTTAVAPIAIPTVIASIG